MTIIDLFDNYVPRSIVNYVPLPFYTHLAVNILNAAIYVNSSIANKYDAFDHSIAGIDVNKSINGEVAVYSTEYAVSSVIDSLKKALAFSICKLLTSPIPSTYFKRTITGCIPLNTKEFKTTVKIAKDETKNVRLICKAFRPTYNAKGDMTRGESCYVEFNSQDAWIVYHMILHSRQFAEDMFGKDKVDHVVGFEKNPMQIEQLRLYAEETEKIETEYYQMVRELNKQMMDEMDAIKEKYGKAVREKLMEKETLKESLNKQFEDCLTLI